MRCTRQISPPSLNRCIASRQVQQKKKTDTKQKTLRLGVDAKAQALGERFSGRTADRAKDTSSLKPHQAGTGPSHRHVPWELYCINTAPQYGVDNALMNDIGYVPGKGKVWNMIIASSSQVEAIVKFPRADQLSISFGF